MKKLLSIILALAMIGCLLGCSSSSDQEEVEEPEAVEAETEEGTEDVVEEPVEEPEEEPEAVFDLEEYETMVGEFRNAAYNNVLALYNMYNYQCNYWSTLLSISGKDPSGEDLAEKAFSWLEENSDYTQSGIEENDEVIRDSYKEIILMEIDGREAEELDEAVQDMYDNYTTAYSTITNASGDLDSFKSVASNAINSFNKTDDTVKLLLGIDE